MTRRPSVVRALFLAMMGTGLAMGLVFPLVVSPFADYRPGMRLAFSALCVVAGLVVGGLNFLLVRRFLLRPVDLVSRQLESLASGEGISATRLSLDSDDALGRLVLQFNALIDRLQGTLRRVIETVEAFVVHADDTGQTARELVANVDRKSQVVAGTAILFAGLRQELMNIEEVLGRLTESAAESRTAVGAQARQIAAVNGQIVQLEGRNEASAGAMDRAGAALQRTSGSTQELTRALEEASASMTEMDFTVREIDRNLKDSSLLAERVATDAAAGARRWTAPGRAWSGSGTASRRPRRRSPSSPRRVGEIAAVTGVIDEVTEQTGLLALNAAIIAAQAGRARPGFRRGRRRDQESRQPHGGLHPRDRRDRARLPRAGGRLPGLDEPEPRPGRRGRRALGPGRRGARLDPGERRRFAPAGPGHRPGGRGDRHGDPRLLGYRGVDRRARQGDRDGHRRAGPEIAALQGTVQDGRRATDAIAVAEPRTGARGAADRAAGRGGGRPRGEQRRGGPGGARPDRHAGRDDRNAAGSRCPGARLLRPLRGGAGRLAEKAQVLRQEIERLKPRDGDHSRAPDAGGN